MEWGSSKIGLVFMCWVKLSWRTPTAVRTSEDPFSKGSTMPLSHYPISQGTDYFWSSSTLMAEEAGRFEVGMQPHGKGSGRIHIWLLGWRHCPGVCFHGPSISLSAVVTLLVYDQCFQTLGRLKLHIYSQPVQMFVFLCLHSRSEREKHWSNKQVSSNTSISKGKCSYSLTQECMTSHTLVTKEVSSGSESGNSLIQPIISRLKSVRALFYKSHNK